MIRSEEGGREAGRQGGRQAKKGCLKEELKEKVKGDRLRPRNNLHKQREREREPCSVEDYHSQQATNSLFGH